MAEVENWAGQIMLFASLGFAVEAILLALNAISELRDAIRFTPPGYRDRTFKRTVAHQIITVAVMAAIVVAIAAAAAAALT